MALVVDRTLPDGEGVDGVTDGPTVTLTEALAEGPLAAAVLDRFAETLALVLDGPAARPPERDEVPVGPDGTAGLAWHPAPPVPSSDAERHNAAVDWAALVTVAAGGWSGLAARAPRLATLVARVNRMSGTRSPELSWVRYRLARATGRPSPVGMPAPVLAGERR